MAIGILTFLFVFFIIILCSRIKLFNSVMLTQEEHVIRVVCYFYRIRLFEKSIDLAEADRDQKEETFQDSISFLHKSSRNFAQKAQAFHETVSFILIRLRFHNLSWRTEIGTGKAHTTGIAVGGVWTSIGAVMGILTAKSHFLCEPTITVTPLFNQKHISSTFDCMISIRVGQAIYALLKIIRKYPVKREATI
ncbi:hypothetical protein GCM10007063_18880 [Lentibacillus kapialis]|uniref:DUF2953 domain-containing protein n=1 Tax=Lentibacillus kapialis TaxID=340214 RepID=A0A917PX41_9BACI|nr:DUF2953 domain-containing protein [Lentibacillus kapialis]GGJ96653.1 hypothetical protein GCM10007063_18880 [Lentibacillus kapialis]